MPKKEAPRADGDGDGAGNGALDSRPPDTKTPTPSQLLSVPKCETIRRLLWGDLLTVVGHRTGHTPPEDDDGRDSLHLMLRIAAVAEQAADKKMRTVI